MSKEISLTEDQIIAQFEEWLTDCDADELARVAGELFGGECFPDEDYEFNESAKYNFVTNENYFGAFDTFCF